MEGLVNPDRAFWKNQRVLITGHTGFKGAWLAHWLRSLQVQLAGFALAPEGGLNLFSQSGLAEQMDHLVGDIRDLDAARQAIEQVSPTVIFHLAAQSLVRRSYAEPLVTLATNVMGTANILEAARSTPSVKAVVVVTTDKCYLNEEWVWPYRESDPLGGRDIYSASKAAAEIATGAYRDSFLASAGKMVATARAGNVIGGGDWAEDRLVPDCIRAFVAGEKVKLRNPLSTRPWQHVLEPLLGYILLAERLACGDMAAASAFNFGPDQSDEGSVGQVVDEIARLWGGDAAWLLDTGANPHEARLLSVDSSRARAVLAWRPRLELKQALAWTVDWYRSIAFGASAWDMTRRQIDQYVAGDL